MYKLNQLFSQKGYSLIQMAIAMVVLGVLVAPFANIYLLDKKTNQAIDTQKNLDSITFAIQDYKQAFGVYPRPAPMKILRFDSAYGHAVSAATMTAVGTGACGTNASSLCVQNSPRTTLANRRVIVGAIPFRLLQLSEDQSADAYGSKFIYAVTESQTEPSTYDEKNGGIDITDNTKSLVEPAGSSAFIVVGTGPDHVGGYTLQGVQTQACAGLGKDVQNCNPGFETGTSVPSNAVYTSILAGSADNSSHFDDYLSYSTKNVDPLWRRAKTDDENIQVVPTGNVGVGVAAPATGVKLDITSASATPPRSSVLVTGASGTDGKLIVQQVCDPDGTHCFDPSTIGGAGIDCGNGKFMSGINGTVAQKADCNLLSDLSIGCPLPLPEDQNNVVLLGINTVGGKKVPVCGPKPLPACAATTATLCSANDVTLPQGADKSVAGPFSSGVCASASYTCGSKVWTQGTITGRCSFIPKVTKTTGIACPFGYSGTYETTSTTLCLGGSAVVSTQAIACKCVGATSSSTQTCNAYYGSTYYSGNVTTTKTANATTCAVTTTVDKSQCVCNAPSPLLTETSGGSCPAGQIGSIIQPIKFNNAVGTCKYVNDGAAINKCTCDTPSPSTRSVYSNSCPSGYAGNVEQVQVYDPTKGVCAWKDSGSPIKHCTCNTASSTRSADHTCSDPVCDSSDSANPDIFTTTVNAATCTKTEQLTTVGSCKSNNFFWRAVTGASPGAGTPSNPNYIGVTTCDCATYKSAARQFCYQQGDSSYARYQCTCQK
ncbi:MAG: prepilin-type N-terminal cleavage/methylation domain protein [Micavibrio sp.]|nr:prepilin-type N-terminal cleavage/methylation domain protein [Micavibrio sp.]